jgi:hypothetical protein
MFVTNKLVFLETQKTGGTHIRRLLDKYTDGEPVGKHNRLTDEYVDRFVFGSIRNPWDWYVSLWAYGVSGRGAIRSRSTSGIDFNYYHRMLPKAMGKNWLTPAELIISLYHDLIKPISNWQRTYDEAANPKQFRQWLCLLLDKKRRFDIGEGYGFSPVSSHAGLLTYRYFRLFTRGDSIFKDGRLKRFDGLANFDHDLNIASDMIKTESLEEDFIRIMSASGHALSEIELDAIRKKSEEKTNVSARHSASVYYDDETRDLVADKDRYLIEKYSYTPPL